MSRIEFATMTSLPVTVAGSCALLLHFTSLPFWAALLIALPLGAILGVFIGIGLGFAIDFTFRKSGLITPSSVPKRRKPQA